MAAALIFSNVVRSPMQQKEKRGTNRGDLILIGLIYMYVFFNDIYKLQV